MRDRLYRKGLVLAVICLFIGAGVSSVASVIETKNLLSVSEVESTVVNSNTEKTGVSDWPCDCDIIVPDDYPKIQEAIDAANSEYCICVRDGIYYENLIIDKDGLTLCGENKNTTVIDGGGNDDVVYVSADRVNISGFRIQNSGREGGWVYVDAGILLHSNCNTISDNIISHNLDGIFVSGSNNNIISNNIFLSNIWVGIDLFQCYGNTISDNSFFNDGFMVYDAFQSTIYNNTVNDKPVVYLEEESNKVIEDEAGQVILVNCDNITIKNQKLSHIQHGILLYGTNNCCITNNNISTNKWYGILLGYSRNNIIYNNTLLNNNVSIYLRDSSNINVISFNTISYNNYNGILLEDSSDNLIYFNCFIRNDINVFENKGYNQYDNGSHGNYWSDQWWRWDRDKDGISDTKYYIPVTGVDRYPMMYCPCIPDRIPPEMQVIIPREGYIHVDDKGPTGETDSGATIILSIFQTPLTMRVEATDDSGIGDVCVYLDEIDFTDSKPDFVLHQYPLGSKMYTGIINKWLIGPHELTFVATDVFGNAVNETISIFFIYLPIPTMILEFTRKPFRQI